jgi:Integrase core domain
MCTATEFTNAVLGQGCKLSMDGRGAWRDNVFVERLWRSVKYERVYLKAYDGVSAARADIVDYVAWYSSSRAHPSLDDATPDEHYFSHLPTLAMAAEDEVSGAPRASYRVGRFVASADRRRGQLCIVCNPPAVHLKIGESCSDKQGHFCSMTSIMKLVSRFLRHVIKQGAAKP